MCVFEKTKINAKNISECSGMLLTKVRAQNRVRTQRPEAAEHRPRLWPRSPKCKPHRGPTSVFTYSRQWVIFFP